MNILRIIAGALKTRTLGDPVFGTLRFHKAGFWKGKIRFRPLSSEIEILIDGDSTGPTEEQRSWFKNIEERYPAMLPQLIEEAMPRIHEWNKKLTKEKLLAELKLKTILINRCKPGMQEWDITFYIRSLKRWLNITLAE